MGLRETLARAAASRAHLLAVEVPGHWHARAAVEREALRRGWSLALSPADADVLAVCGEPGPELSRLVDVVWQQLPGPRVRVRVAEPPEAPARLEEAHAALLDTDAHRRDASSRPAGTALLDSDEQDEQGDQDEQDEQDEHNPHEDMDHGDMDHGDMEMSPGGIPLAGGGDDRDGLEMDVLHVRLGPVLRHWPAGLSLRCTLQGDVVTEAQAELVDDATPAGEHADTARHLDGIATFLAVAGWDDGAAEARSIRDALLTDGPDPAHRVRALHRRVRRSVALRWALRGVRPLSDEDLDQHGLPGRLAGDTFGRLLWMLQAAESAMAGEPRADLLASLSTDQLARLVTGLDVATARLVVASLGAVELRETAAKEAQHA